MARTNFASLIRAESCHFTRGFLFGAVVRAIERPHRSHLSALRPMRLHHPFFFTPAWALEFLEGSA